MKLVVVMYGQIGYAFHVLGEYEAAMYYHKKQLQLAWDEGVKSVETNIYDNIGMEYYYLGDLEKSTYYHDVSMRGGQKLDKSVKLISPKSKENVWYEFKQEYLLKSGAGNPVSNAFIEKAYGVKIQIECTQKMRYIKEKGFSADLTKACIDKLKQKLKRDLLPSPRKLATNHPAMVPEPEVLVERRNILPGLFNKPFTNYGSFWYSAPFLPF